MALIEIKYNPDDRFVGDVINDDLEFYVCACLSGGEILARTESVGNCAFAHSIYTGDYSDVIEILTPKFTIS